MVLCICLLNVNVTLIATYTSKLFILSYCDLHKTFLQRYRNFFLVATVNLFVHFQFIFTSEDHIYLYINNFSHHLKGWSKNLYLTFFSFHLSLLNRCLLSLEKRFRNKIVSWLIISVNDESYSQKQTECPSVDPWKIDIRGQVAPV